MDMDAYAYGCFAKIVIFTRFPCCRGRRKIAF